MNLYESAGDDQGAARARIYFAFGLFQMGRLEEASEANKRALTTLRERRDKWGVATSLMRQASIDRYRQRAISDGRDLFAQALAAFKALGDEIGAANTLGNIKRSARDRLAAGYGRDRHCYRPCQQRCVSNCSRGYRRRA